ncbi:protein of unknown function [Streptococcus thermophilus]|nr:protein of unknown function [Streptococcus thermophilus]CAD0165734.1 protein of unknown function [Streptococcus thermophilus]
MVPIGEDRLSIITGRRKMFDFEDGYSYPAKESIDMYNRYKEILLSLVKWALRLIDFLLLGLVFFLRVMRLSQMKLG